MGQREAHDKALAWVMAARRLSDLTRGLLPLSELRCLREDLSKAQNKVMAEYGVTVDEVRDAAIEDNTEEW